MHFAQLCTIILISLSVFCNWCEFCIESENKSLRHFIISISLSVDRHTNICLPYGHLSRKLPCYHHMLHYTYNTRRGANNPLINFSSFTFFWSVLANYRYKYYVDTSTSWDVVTSKSVWKKWKTIKQILFSLEVCDMHFYFLAVHNGKMKLSLQTFRWRAASLIPSI